MFGWMLYLFLKHVYVHEVAEHTGILEAGLVIENLGLDLVHGCLHVLVK
jgi:hypothetical protein